MNTSELLFTLLAISRKKQLCKLPIHLVAALIGASHPLEQFKASTDIIVRFPFSSEKYKNILVADFDFQSLYDTWL